MDLILQFCTILIILANLTVSQAKKVPRFAFKERPRTSCKQDSCNGRGKCLQDTENS